LLKGDAFSPESRSLRAYVRAMLEGENKWDGIPRQKNVPEKKR
jgi:hypothetical protein